MKRLLNQLVMLFLGLLWGIVANAMPRAVEDPDECAYRLSQTIVSLVDAAVSPQIPWVSYGDHGTIGWDRFNQTNLLRMLAQAKVSLAHRKRIEHLIRRFAFEDFLAEDDERFYAAGVAQNAARKAKRAERISPSDNRQIYFAILKPGLSLKSGRWVDFNYNLLNGELRDFSAAGPTFKSINRYTNSLRRDDTLIMVLPDFAVPGNLEKWVAQLIGCLSLSDDLDRISNFVYSVKQIISWGWQPPHGLLPEWVGTSGSLPKVITALDRTLVPMYLAMGQGRAEAYVENNLLGKPFTSRVVTVDEQAFALAWETGNQRLIQNKGYDASNIFRLVRLDYESKMLETIFMRRP